jgi:hypothetical protein
MNSDHRVLEIKMSGKDYDAFSLFTEEELLIALKSGVVCMQECKSRLSEATHAEAYKEIERQFFDRISLLSSDVSRLESELEMNKEMTERQSRLYNEKIDEDIDRIVQHKTQVYDRLLTERVNESAKLSELVRMRDREIIELEEKMRVQTSKFEARVQSEVARVGEKMTTVLDRSSSVLESVVANSQTKSSSEIGAIGEQCFSEVAKTTFCDFDGFDLEDVHNQPHKGDFLLSVRGLTIMVDSKFYKRNVDNPQIDKIKSDLRRNTNIRFAWLVSLYSDIDKRDKGTFMFEWITDEQCVVHINRLMLLENRETILKSIFFLCQDYDKQISSRGTGNDELLSIKKNYFKVAERVGDMRKRMRELKAVIVSTRSLYDQLEKDLVNLMNDESNDVNVKYHGIVTEWVALNMQKADGSRSKSTIIWNNFKKENPQLSQEMSVSKFKEILIAVIGDDHIEMPKGKTGAFDVINMQLYQPKSDPKPDIIKVET